MLEFSRKCQIPTTDEERVWTTNLSAIASTIGVLFHFVGQVAGVVPKLLVLDALEISVTSPLPLNTHPVAGTIATGSAFGLDRGFTAGFFELCCCDVVAGIRVSVQTTSLVRGSSGLGGKPPRPVTVKLLPPSSEKAAQ
ncbi:MAG: hypothetical protein DSM106950_07680 [Stigonema ocellatum SAG 48.90 = DSM 106950]|nr:hypothetical protein [Stigonema ocellatum SAG 48.90 = DSM 106950]